MAKSREKIQQIGFWDTEVSKPDHDEVCLWAYENADTILRILYPDQFDHQWLKNEVREHIKNGQTFRDQAKEFADTNPRPNPYAFKKTLEFVLKSHTGHQGNIERIVGYADLIIETGFPYIEPIYKNGESWGADQVFDGYQINWKPESILIEAKSVLPTVGELMRQIQLYRTAFRGRFVVVSPDDSYAQILAEQGVAFIQFKRKSN